jgi:hypothetical protein
MSIQVSRLLRLALEDRFVADFNTNLNAACHDFAIDDLAYKINFTEADGQNFTEADGQPQNFYRGNWTLDSLIALREPDLPALAMWTGEGAQYGPGERQMPRTFSGFVFAHWRFFLAVKGRREGLTDLREATESAMISTLDAEFSGTGYRGDLAWQALPDQIWIDQDQKAVGFGQQVEYQASFEVQV